MLKLPKWLGKKILERKPEPPLLTLGEVKKQAAIQEMATGNVTMAALIRRFQGDEAKYISSDFTPWFVFEGEDKTLYFGLTHYEVEAADVLKAVKREDTEAGVFVTAWTADGPYPTTENQLMTTIPLSPQYLLSNEAEAAVKAVALGFAGIQDYQVVNR